MADIGKKYYENDVQEAVKGVIEGRSLREVEQSFNEPISAIVGKAKLNCTLLQPRWP